MNQITTLLVLAVLSSQTNSAPQFVTFKDGKLGVNFGGYHAGVGIGGLLGGGNGAGGLYAEAGTPTGQAARAGLGGVVSENGGTSGGLYAGATAGGNVKAHAGLGGAVTAEKSAGGGFASAQAGPHYASSGLGGETSVEGTSGVVFSSSNDVIKPVHSHKTFYTEYNADAANEVRPLPKVDIIKEVHVQESAQPVIVKEVSNIWRAGTEFNNNVNLLHDFRNFLNSLLSVTITADRQRLRQKPHHIYDYTLSQVYVPPKTKIIEKEIIHMHKPHRHHLRKTAFLGGYIGGQGNIVAPPPLVYKTVEPTIQKRVDVEAEAAAHVDTGASIQGSGGIGGGHYYTKSVSVQKSPTFFADIFNIPISALRAVGDFLGNTAANTNISVQKTASVQAESDGKSLKHEPLSSSSSSSSVSSASNIVVETPSASKIIDDIFAIPINTLGAVNKFLENNAAAKKNVQVSEDGTIEKRIRLGPHARRKANRHVVIVQEPTPT